MIIPLYRADPNLVGQRVKMLTSSRTSVDSDIANIETGPWDYVVRTMADLPTPVAGLINLTAGSWAFPVALNIGANIIVVPGGVECHLKGFWGEFLTGTSTNLIAVNGIALLETMALSNDAPLLLSGVGGICECAHCDIIAISACIVTTVAFSQLSVFGGIWQRFAGTPSGLHIACDVDDIRLVGVRGTGGLNRFVRYVSGAIASALIHGCTTDAATGIDWAAASLPANGLALLGNNLNCGTPLNGFTAASARANLKGNVENGALMSETAIVP
jgi:hypothetical protein